MISEEPWPAVLYNMLCTSLGSCAKTVQCQLRVSVNEYQPESTSIMLVVSSTSQIVTFSRGS